MVQKYPISEIFYSLQGEGSTLGLPRIFIRVSGCNLRCKWCDSAYTWKEGALMTCEQIANTVKKYRKNCDIVLTGGEPLLYDWNPLFTTLGFSYRYEIETNGTILPKDSVFVKKYNVSIKLSSSGVPISKRIKPDVIKAFCTFDLNECIEFKFVVSDMKDVTEIKELHNKYQFPNITVMPQGVTKEEVLEGMKMLVPVCKKNNWRLSPRLQTLIWGQKRGV